MSNLEVLRAAIVLTFLAEWGDRSQITTIALATEETFVVLVGALLGHFICTSLAVLGGKMISSKISEKYVLLKLIKLDSTLWRYFICLIWVT